jgi:UDP-N-acetylmuramoylalanine--D-glutamate ligase
MLSEAGLHAPAGGNLGPALSDQVPLSRPDSIHVVEVSSFQLEATEAFHPWIAVLLNLSPDHLDRHASFDEYRAAKARVFANQVPSDWAVINADDPAALALARGGKAQRFDFALEAPLSAGVTVEGADVVRRGPAGAMPLLPVSSVRVAGRHLLSDVVAAAAVGCLAGVPPAAMRRAVEGFAGLEHAFEKVAVVDGVTFINDSKATNIVATRRALEQVEPGTVAILGGRYKGGAFEDLRDVAAARVKAIVAIGEAQPLVERALAPVVPVTRAGSMGEAVRLAFDLARPRGSVLLAPACSSFDMFRDYAARGRAFKDEVARLTGGPAGGSPGS